MTDGNDYYRDLNGDIIDLYGDIPADAWLIAEQIRVKEEERKRETESK